MSLDLDKLAQLEASATPGPWEAVAGAFGDPANGPDHMRVVREGWSNAHDPEHTVARMEYDQQGGADAALIAALRNAAPALIAAARVSRDERRAAEDLADRLDRVAAERDAARAEVAALRQRIEALADEWSRSGFEMESDQLRAALTTGADQ